MRLFLATLALTAPLLAGIPARAQGAGPAPVPDVTRGPTAVDRQLGIRPNSPDRPANGITPSTPSGVAGFDGPPGTPGDSVNNSGPLPPGSPANGNR